MALDVVAKVFPPTPVAEAEALLNAWLAAHQGVQIAFVSQSSHTGAGRLYLTFSLFYTEPTDQDRARQRQMQAEDAADRSPTS